MFYADNGSAGVEVALKMAFHWFHNRGEHRRTKFIALENGYHGETIGALAVGDVPLYRRVYAPLLAEALFAPSPDAYLAAPGETAVECAERAADALRDAARAPRRRSLRADPGTAACNAPAACACTIRSTCERARELCDAHGVLLIADEIAVGFGRTGTLFACEQAGIQPDLMCLSKGLTGEASDKRKKKIKPVGRRPKKPIALRDLILKVARETGWGYTGFSARSAN